MEIIKKNYTVSNFFHCSSNVQVNVLGLYCTWADKICYTAKKFSYSTFQGYTLEVTEITKEI